MDGSSLFLITDLEKELLAQAEISKRVEKETKELKRTKKKKK